MTAGAIDSSVYANNYYLATGNTASNYNSYLEAVTEAQSFNDLLDVDSSVGTTSSTQTSLADNSLVDTVSLSPAALNILQFLQGNNIGNIGSNDNSALFNSSTLTQSQQAELTTILQNLGLNSQQQTQVLAVFTQFTTVPTTQDPTTISQTEAQNEDATATNTAPTATPAATTTTDNTAQATTPDANPNNSNIAYSAPDSTEALMQSFISGYVQQPLPPEHNKRQFSQT